MVYMPPSTEGNEALGDLVGSLIVKTAGNLSRRGHLGDPLAHGEGPTGAIHRVTRQGAWPLRGHPCVGLQQGLGEACALLVTSVKIMASLNGTLHLYRPLASALSLCTLVVCLLS
jgi:hypothetical protein